MIVRRVSYLDCPDPWFVGIILSRECRVCLRPLADRTDIDVHVVDLVVTQVKVGFGWWVVEWYPKVGRPRSAAESPVKKGQG